MKELFAAITGRFSQDSGVSFMDRTGDVVWEDNGDIRWHKSFYEDIGGRMYLDEIPQNKAYPNATFSLIHNQRDWSFTDEFTEANIQFNVYSKSKSVAEITDAYYKLTALFDDCRLASSDLGGTWRHVSMIQDGSWLGKIPAPDSTGGGGIWRYVVEYKVVLNK